MDLYRSYHQKKPTYGVSLFFTYTCNFLYLIFFAFLCFVVIVELVYYLGSPFDFLAVVDRYRTFVVL